MFAHTRILDKFYQFYNSQQSSRKYVRTSNSDAVSQARQAHLMISSLLFSVAERVEATEDLLIVVNNFNYKKKLCIERKKKQKLVRNAIIWELS